jgi:hypothetical protein
MPQIDAPITDNQILQSSTKKPGSQGNGNLGKGDGCKHCLDRVGWTTVHDDRSRTQRSRKPKHQLSIVALGYRNHLGEC